MMWEQSAAAHSFNLVKDYSMQDLWCIIALLCRPFLSQEFCLFISQDCATHWHLQMFAADLCSLIAGGGVSRGCECCPRYLICAWLSVAIWDCFHYWLRTKLLPPFTGPVSNPFKYLSKTILQPQIVVKAEQVLQDASRSDNDMCG